MSGLKRFWIGGSGALLPLLITLIGADLAVMIDQHDQLTPGVIIGAGIRYLSLFVLGGFVAALHTDEMSPVKLAQLGIAAPALITSYISVGPVTGNTNIAFNVPSIISTALAADPSPSRNNQRGEIIVAGSFLGDFFKGWSQPLNRTVKRKPRRDVKVKTGKVVPQVAAAPAQAKPAKKAKSPPSSKQTLEQRRQALLKKKRKIERELKSLGTR